MGGSLHQPLTQNLYLYTTGNPVNYSDPSGHGLFSNIVNGVKNVVTTVVNTVVGTVKTVVNTVTTAATKVVTTVAGTAAKTVSTASSVASKVVTTVTKTVVPVAQAAANTAGKIASSVVNGVTGAFHAANAVVHEVVAAGTNILGTVLDMQVQTLATVNRVFCSADALKVSSTSSGKTLNAGITLSPEEAIWIVERALKMAAAENLLTGAETPQEAFAVAVPIILWFLVEWGITILGGLLVLFLLWLNIEVAIDGASKVNTKTDTKTDIYQDPYAELQKKIAAGEVVPAQAVAAEALEDVMNDPRYKEIPGIDCAEIAEDLYETNDQKGTIYHITPIIGLLYIYTYGIIESVDYHDIYSYTDFIYDPRYSVVPVTKDSYFSMLVEINPGGFNVSTLSL